VSFQRAKRYPEFKTIEIKGVLIMGFLTFILLDGALHLAWSLAYDNIGPLRNMVHKNTMAEGTKQLVQELRRMGVSIVDDN
jgi:hypothetical protein